MKNFDRNWQFFCSVQKRQVSNRAFSEKENYINTKEPQLQVSMMSHYLQQIELCFVRRQHFRREQRPPPLPWPSWRLQPRALRPDRGGRRRRSRSRGPVCLRQKRQGWQPRNHFHGCHPCLYKLCPIQDKINRFQNFAPLFRASVKLTMVLQPNLKKIHRNAPKISAPCFITVVGYYLLLHNSSRELKRILTENQIELTDKVTKNVNDRNVGCNTNCVYAKLVQNGQPKNAPY